MKPGVLYPTFPHDEYRGRVERAKRTLERHGLDAMLLFSPANLWYYAGLREATQMYNGVWRSAVLLCRERDPVALVHGAYLPSLALTSYVDDVRAYSDVWHTIFENILRKGPNSFLDLCARELEDLGLARSTLGIETGCDSGSYFSFDEHEALRSRLPKARVVSADAAIFAQRMIKSPWEQATMREGLRLACDCVRAAFEAIRPGANERDVHRAYWTRAAELGMIEAPYWGQWTCFTANAHDAGPWPYQRFVTAPVDRTIEWGDVGMCDGGCMYKGYQFDFQRTFSVGEPPAKMRRFAAIATEAQLETLAMIKPGVPLRDLYCRSAESMKKKGYEIGHAISFVGHQEGLMHHEPPWVSASAEEVCQPGMVMAIEIGAFDPEGETFGAYPEDVVLVTDAGCENMTRHLSHEIWVAS